ncbi:MAG: M1 family aminopeptidase [Oligoflexia bacterium]|nr:M1 family aminopeptidase [Oligoflexia bacterium]
MENIKDLIGCRCHAGNYFAPRPHVKEKVPAHTFPWAKVQYSEERPVLPIHQFLDLVLDVKEKTLKGSNTISFKVAYREVNSFKIDSIDLRISTVEINKKSIQFEVQEKHIMIFLPDTLKRGDTGEVKINYEARDPKAGIYFINPDDKYPNRPIQVWTQGQDDDSRYWFPSFDEPGIKCSFEMKIEVPAGFIATSNGALLSESRSGKYWTFHWRSGALIPSYLVTLTAGMFSEIKETWRGKLVAYLCEKGREEEVKLSFGKTPKMMDLFSEKLGVEYPYEKYYQIAVAEFVFGGMENTSATTQTDTVLHPLELDEDFTSDDLVSHELAHQWFGNLVTCKSWSHGWLNEGWATFMETVFKEVDLGVEETHYFRFEELNIYLAEDSGLYRRPIVTHFYSDPGEVWDRHLYQKGGLVLNMLKNLIGNEDFWNGTKNYLLLHKGGAVETVDFQRALEKESGKNLQEFFDQWIFKAGHPELKAGFEWDQTQKIAKLKFNQKQTVDALTSLFKIDSEIEFVFSDKSVVKLPIKIDEKEQTFAAHLKEKPLYCRFDVGNSIIKTLEWALPLEMLKNQLKNDDDVIGKIWAIKAIAKEATSEGIDTLIDRLDNDSFWGIRIEAAAALGSTRSNQARKALLRALKKEKKGKVRTRICLALGDFRDQEVADVLIATLESDKNIFVRGAAANALGRTKSQNAFDALKKALKTKTWNDYVATHANVGLRMLRDANALPLFLENARYGAPKFARPAATIALGEYGLDRVEVTEFLKESLDDPYLRVRFAATDALVRRRDPSVAWALEDAAHRIVDGHFKAAAFRAAKRVRHNQERPEEFTDFKDTLEKLLDENRKLKDRMEMLEVKPPTLIAKKSKKTKRK